MTDAGEVTLKEVLNDDWDRVIALRRTEGDDRLVASNACSLAETRINIHATALAICVAGEIVGFLMYERLAEEGRPHAYSIFRLMVDARHRGRGIARAAIRHVIDRLMNDPELELISICYVADNAAARNLYRSLGFKEIGLDEDGEMIAEFRP